jgi:hypothetical protein
LPQPLKGIRNDGLRRFKININLVFYSILGRITQYTYGVCCTV